MTTKLWRGVVLKIVTMSALALMCNCASTESAQRELEEVTFMYHRDLRWQRCSQAAKRLAPELREAFAVSCGELEGKLGLEGLEIVDVDIAEDNNSAWLSVRFTYVLTPSVTMQRATMREHWLKVDGQWLLQEGAWPLNQEIRAKTH